MQLNKERKFILYLCINKFIKEFILIRFVYMKTIIMEIQKCAAVLTDIKHAH